jgi:hypothetical protein
MHIVYVQIKIKREIYTVRKRKEICTKKNCHSIRARLDGGGLESE